jgi:hypothetical protein
MRFRACSSRNTFSIRSIVLLERSIRTSWPIEPVLGSIRIGAGNPVAFFSRLPETRGRSLEEIEQSWHP